MKEPGLRAAYDSKRTTSKQSQPSHSPTASAQAKSGADKTPVAKEDEKLQAEAKVIEARLRTLRNRKYDLDAELFECKKTVTKLEAELELFRKQDEEDVRVGEEANSWWTYLTSPIIGVRPGHDGQSKERREAVRLQRVAARRIKEPELTRARGALEGKKTAVRFIDEAIALEGGKKGDVEWKRFEMNQREERRRKEEELRKQRAEQERRGNMARERWEEQMRKADAEREQRDKAERERFEELRRRVQEQRRDTEEAASARFKAFAGKDSRPKPSSSRASAGHHTTTPTPSPHCSHSAYWSQIDGRDRCNQCGRLQHKFTFECPGCGIRACASCRRTLKSARWSG